MRSPVAHLSRRVFLAMVALFAPAASLRLFARQPSAISLDQFIDVSQRLLGRTKLDREVAQIYLDAVMANADDAVQLAYLVESNANPTPEMKALAATIIEWWYTGVYTRDGKPRVATHTGALMWSTLGMPAPGTCGSAFGAWSQPPDTLA
jgi:hypothetical protein